MNNEENKINGLESAQPENEELTAVKEDLCDENADVTAADDTEPGTVESAAETEPLQEESDGITDDAAENEQQGDFSQVNDEQLFETEEPKKRRNKHLA